MALTFVREMSGGASVWRDDSGQQWIQLPDGTLEPDTVVQTNGDSWSGVSDLLKQGLTLYQMREQQRAFTEVNKARAAQGLPPLSWSEFQPTASVGVTLDPKILWTIAGVGLLLAIGLFGGKRR